MMKVAVCLIGTEDIIEKDLNGKKLIPGRVVFEEGNNFNGVKTVYSLIDYFKFGDYDDLVEKISNLNFEFDGTFRVNCRREGEHDFDSQTLAKDVGEKIHEKGFKVDLKNSKHTIYIDIVDKDCLVGFLEKDNLCKRDYRVRLVGQSLNVCLAYCIVRLLDKGDLIDPFCRDGILVIEAAKLKYGKLYADDMNKNNLRHIQTNAALAEVEVELVDFYEFNEKINIVTFLPIVSSKTKYNEKKIEKFFEKANSIAKKMLICTLNPDMVKKYSKLKLKSERIVKVGDFNYSLLEY